MNVMKVEDSEIHVWIVSALPLVAMNICEGKVSERIVCDSILEDPCLSSIMNLKVKYKVLSLSWYKIWHKLKSAFCSGNFCSIKY